MRGRGLRLTRSSGRRCAPDNEAHRLLCFQLTAANLGPFETEYRFALEIERDFRWDIAFLEPKLAVEVDGGIWSKGAHGHPVTILRNMEKRNYGARLGWRILAFDTKEVPNGKAIAFIFETLTGKPWAGGLLNEVSTSRRRARSVRKAYATLA